ncbi:hypothetical protein ACTFQN_19430 [Bacillus cereus group sp. MYBK30-1]|uniref:hypothetical protein n=1 Tax=unclassified Bacillus cereus group TaxID=2750818 RepID=UPI003F7A8BAF
MKNTIELDRLMDLFKNDNEGVYDYLEYLLESERLQAPDAIALIKYAIEHDIEALSEKELRIIVIDILKNDAFIFVCEWCTNSLGFEDMITVLEITRDKHKNCYEEMEEACN